MRERDESVSEGWAAEERPPRTAAVPAVGTGGSGVAVAVDLGDETLANRSHVPPVDTHVHVEVTVVDEAGAAVSTGSVGEVVVSGSTVTSGYYGAPEATAEAFGPHGFHTGDAGYRDEEGRLWILNRLDDRIVTGGENVDPGEVAATLREHPDVDDAFVLGLPDEEYGQRVAALLVGTDDVDDVESFARKQLAGFKLPRTWQVVDALPRTASGTVDRSAARARFDEV